MYSATADAVVFSPVITTRRTGLQAILDNDVFGRGGAALVSLMYDMTFTHCEVGSVIPLICSCISESSVDQWIAGLEKSGSRR